MCGIHFITWPTVNAHVVFMIPQSSTKESQEGHQEKIGKRGMNCAGGGQTADLGHAKGPQ